MNKSNISLFESGSYKYIFSAEIKNENEQIQKWILSLEKRDGAFNETIKGESRLIVGYSENRAKKDKHNRDTA